MEMLNQLIAFALSWGTQFMPHIERFVEYTEHTCAAMVIVWESTGEPELGQKMVMQVLYNRMQENNPQFGGQILGYKTRCGAALHFTVRNTDGKLVREFSPFEEKPKKPLVLIGEKWERARAISRSAPNVETAAYNSIFYFYNPDIAGKGGKCWFAVNTLPVVKVARHHFHGRPDTVWEWNALRKVTCDNSPERSISTVLEARLPRPRPVAVASRVPRPRPMLLAERPMS